MSSAQEAFDIATAVYLVKALGGGWRENPDRISRSN